MNTPISVTILTKNSSKYLREVLASLEMFDEILVCDTGSSDDTIEIARSNPKVTLYESSFKGFGLSHNEASRVARNNWVLSIDSDEVMTPSLAAEILKEPLRQGVVYSIARQNFYRGKWIRGCGWSPDRQFRLYNRLDTSFTEALVHESIDVKGMKHHSFKGFIKHYSYACVADFLSKMQSYSTLFAEQNTQKKKGSLGRALSHGFFAFFKSYVLKKGFLDGREGFEISFYNGNTAFYKYLKLMEANDKQSEALCDDPKRMEDG